MVIKFKSMVAGLAAVCLLVVGATVPVGAASNANPQGKVTICHATGSTKNPFVRVPANKNGDVSGHAGSSHQSGRDIIPPFTYQNNGQTKQFPGQNWNAQGQATYNNNCVPTTPGRGSGQVAQGSGAAGAQATVPAGSVEAGIGDATGLSAEAAIGLAASIGLAGFGALRLRKLVN